MAQTEGVRVPRRDTEDDQHIVVLGRVVRLTKGGADLEAVKWHGRMIWEKVGVGDRAGLHRCALPGL